MKYLFSKILLVMVTIFTAPLVFAQGPTLRSIVAQIVDLLSTAVMPLLFLAALTFFIFGVVQFIRNSDNQEKRKEGRKRMLWGVIALFVMVSYLGITAVFTETFFNRQPTLPQLYEKAN